MTQPPYTDHFLRPCARCGRPVDMLGDGHRMMFRRPVHLACLGDGAAAEGQPCEYYTIAEAAEVLRVSDKTIRRRIADGSLAARRLLGGGHGPYLIARVDLIAMLTETPSVTEAALPGTASGAGDIDPGNGEASGDLREALQTLVDSFGWHRVHAALRNLDGSPPADG